MSACAKKQNRQPSHLVQAHERQPPCLTEALKRLAAEKAAWEAGELAEFLARQPEARTDYRTRSGLPVQRVYTPEDVADAPADEIGLPGRFPYTRGPYPTMYRGRNWTMRQIAGFGTGRGHQRPLPLPDRAGADRASAWTSTCRR